MKIFSTSLFRGEATALLIGAVSLASTGTLGAQTAVSNFNEPVSGGYGISSTARRAFAFTTGATAASFDFTGVTIAFGTPNGNPSGGLTVGLYTTFDRLTNSGTEATPLANLTLVGSIQPAVAGNYSFAGAASLSPNTTYYLKLTSPSIDYYSILMMDSFGETGLSGWSIADESFFSTGSSQVSIWSLSLIHI